MTHDPWSLHASLSCPACHVTGKVVREEDDDNEPPFMCCECGQLWRDDGVCADHWLKEARVAYGRLVEGRPYEAPPPKPRDPDAKHIDASEYDSVLKDYYSAADARKYLFKSPDGAPVWHSGSAVPATAPSDSIGYALSLDTWKLPDGAQPTTMPDTRETDEKIRKLVAETYKNSNAPNCIPVHPSQYKALGLTAPNLVYMNLPEPPAGSELETVDVNEATGVITYRFVKK